MISPRPELLPPKLDEQLVSDLAKLADTLDGHPATKRRDEFLSQFNQLAGSSLDAQDFQDVFEAMSHDEFVRIILYQLAVDFDPNLTVDEMTWIVQRISDCDEQQDFYVELFSVNCQHPAGTGLIFWPDQVPELPQDREPTAREIAELAMQGRS